MRENSFEKGCCASSEHRVKLLNKAALPNQRMHKGCLEMGGGGGGDPIVVFCIFECTYKS